MVDQPEGRPKSPGPGKVKPAAKKHNVSKPYERPSSSRGVLARVKELITPVTPGWLKDLVLRPPQTTSVTDALEQTVAEVQIVQEKKSEDFKHTLKSLTIPSTQQSTPPVAKRTSSILNISQDNNRSANLEDTLGDIKWSSIRPAVKEKYSFSVAAFNTPSKSPNLSSISIHNRSQHNRSTSSPFTNRSRVSYGGTSLQRTLLQQRSNNTSINGDQKPIKVRPISRCTIRQGVTSNTAKKILEQLESLSKPLGHLPSSRPSTPGSRPCSRSSTPLSRPSTPQHLLPYSKSERSVPIRSLTSTPLERAEPRESASFGGKIKREKTNHYTRIKEEEELSVPSFTTVDVPKKEFNPIDLGLLAPKPIKIVNQNQKDSHIPLKDAFFSSLKTMSPPKKSPVSDISSSDSSYSFTAPTSATNASFGLSGNDSVEFTFGTPSSANKSIEEMLKSTKSMEDILRSVKQEAEDEIELVTKEPPGSWSCVPCKLSNPSTMTRCSGCEAPNPSLMTGLKLKMNSPIGIKRAPITPMKPASSFPPKLAKKDPVRFNLTAVKEEEKGTKSTVSFSLPQQSGWACGTCLLRNTDTDDKCVSCQSTRPVTGPSPLSAPSSTSLKLSTMENPLLKFKKTGTWSCDACMLSNPADLTKCKACETAKPAAATTNPLLAFKQPAGWTCDTCMLRNTEDVSKCKACEASKPGAAKPSSGVPKSVFGTLGNFTQKGWSCTMCMLTNDDSLVKCKACETLKPGVKPEDVPKEKNKEKEEVKESTFKFGVSATSSDAGFGAVSSGFDFGSKSEPKTSGFMFGNTKSEDVTETKSGFKFGGAVSESKEEQSKQTINFGGGTSTEKKETPSFNFGGGSATTVPAPSFASSSTAKTDAPTFNFGGNMDNKPAATPTFNFGGTAPAVKKEPAFNFGGGFGEKKTGGFSFGEKSAPAFGGEKSAPTFGGEKSAPAFNFGGNTTQAKSAPTFNFGGSSTTAAPAPSFGTPSAAPAPSFGTPSAAPATSFGTPAAAPAPSFGTPAAAPAPSFGTPAAPAFGSTFQFGGNTAEGSGDTMDASSQSPKGFQFGQNKAATNGPIFNMGVNNTDNKPAFSNTGFNFSATNTPVPFPTATTQNTTPFNFGGTAPAPASTGFSFSSAPAAAPGGFNFGSSAPPAPAFNFGGNGTSFGTPPENNPAFNFGGTNTQSFGNNPTPSFGNTPQQQQPPPTFNFGGTNTTPSTPTTQNMFNAVSSSSSRGARQIRKAVRRTKR